MRERRVRWFNVLRCGVCGFTFSDRHHRYPQAAGGSRSDVIPLCPNHHRCVHILYAMVDAGASDEYIRQFGENYFDKAFLAGFLDDLVEDYRETKDAIRLARHALSQWLVKATLDRLYQDLDAKN